MRRRALLLIGLIVLFLILLASGLTLAQSNNLIVYSSNATVQPGVSIPPWLTEGPVPGGVITGYVLDEDVVIIMLDRTS